MHGVWEKAKSKIIYKRRLTLDKADPLYTPGPGSYNPMKFPAKIPPKYR